MLSRYKILKRLGAGGIGVVYAAEDITLKRKVALKFLTEESFSQEQMRVRFLREARTAASLNHSNICTIYEASEVESGEEKTLGTGELLKPGTPFIAMELIEGRTLSEIIHESGPIGLDKFLDIAVQIAEGMAIAHAGGIVHRDLKPQNVMLTKDGRIKILDFGLAKPLERAEPDDALGAAVDTLSAELTIEGKVMGTVSYMSPEQAQGKTVDSRSDIFSFGTMLYEMAIAKRPFRGDTTASTLAKILETEPEPLEEIRSELPIELGRIVRRCLRKKPDERYNDTRDLVVALKDLKQETSSSKILVAAAVGKGRRVRFAFPKVLMISSAAVIVIAIVILGWLGWRHSKEPGQPPAKSEISLRQLTANPAENVAIDAAISPDGKYIVYSDAIGLHLLSLETSETRSLPCAEANNSYRFSWFPDGTKFLLTSWSGQRDSIWSCSIMTGTSRKLRDDASHPCVSPDGSFVACCDSTFREIRVMRADGSESHTIGNAQEGGYVFSPRWSLDGRRVAWASVRWSKDGKTENAIESADPQGEQPATIFSSTNPISHINDILWLPGSRILFIEDSSDRNQTESILQEIIVDPHTGKASGPPSKISSSIGQNWDWLSATKDGKRITFMNSRMKKDVYVGDLEENDTRLTEPRRLTLDDRNDYSIGWINNCKTVVFCSDRNGTFDIFRQDLDSFFAEPIFTDPNDDDADCMTPDGSSILFWQYDRKDVNGTARLMRFPLSGGAPEMVFDARGQVLRFNLWWGVRCAPNGCIFGQQLNDKELILWSLDPLKGKGQELAKISVEFFQSLNLSTDGKLVALVELNRLRIYSLADSTMRTIPVHDIDRLFGAAWSSDGRHIFVHGWKGGECRVISISLEGESHILWKWMNSISRPLPSPDGRHLALTVFTGDSNVWMMENF